MIRFIILFLKIVLLFRLGLLYLVRLGGHSNWDDLGRGLLLLWFTLLRHPILRQPSWEISLLLFLLRDLLRFRRRSRLLNLLLRFRLCFPFYPFKHILTLGIVEIKFILQLLVPYFLVSSGSDRSHHLLKSLLTVLFIISFSYLIDKILIRFSCLLLFQSVQQSS